MIPNRQRLKLYEPPADDDRGVELVSAGLPRWPTIGLIVALCAAVVYLLGK